MNAGLSNIVHVKFTGRSSLFPNLTKSFTLCLQSITLMSSYNQCYLCLSATSCQTASKIYQTTTLHIYLSKQTNKNNNKLLCLDIRSTN